MVGNRHFYPQNMIAHVPPHEHKLEFDGIGVHLGLTAIIRHAWK